MSRAGLERKLVTWPACGCAAAGTRALRRKDWACEDRAEVGAEATREPRPEKKKRWNCEEKKCSFRPSNLGSLSPFEKGNQFSLRPRTKSPFPSTRASQKRTDSSGRLEVREEQKPRAALVSLAENTPPARRVRSGSRTPSPPKNIGQISPPRSCEVVQASGTELEPWIVCSEKGCEQRMEKGERWMLLSLIHI